MMAFIPRRHLLTKGCLLLWLLSWVSNSYLAPTLHPHWNHQSSNPITSLSALRCKQDSECPKVQILAREDGERCQEGYP
ncbi:uncharacterized protein BJ212DRAFT_407190 [Suillus subaureus]|uniref:Uncharacterized protein n=1 Tax=Suillus subaureus TaxID=48587 RepID=A0A9P7IYG9_9AGAM|nr:uncharacterized protein BJ212DRAFT_407190 [Suillus subaureus]KAG1797168.1 hypothetical protein BJ212DRAFT_407190 [Suillus subaureus]